MISGDFAFKRHRVDVVAERVLARDGERLDAGKHAVAEQRDKRLAARVTAQDLGRRRAEDLVVVAVDEGALETQDLSSMARGVGEGEAVFPGAGVEGEDELGVGQIDEVHVPEGLPVGAVGRIETEEVGLMHEHCVLDVGGFGECGEGCGLHVVCLLISGTWI